MAVNWKNDLDEAIAESQSSNRPLLLDFSAAPA